MTNEKNSTMMARLSIQRALLGQVSQSLRVVAFTLHEREMDIRFYYDGEIKGADIESASCVETEVLADYDEEDVISVKCIRLDYPSIIEDAGVWVFARRE